MRAPVVSGLLLASLLAATPALADPASPEGAQELSRTAAAYFGKAAVDQGIIVIAPQGESYLATIDLQTAIDELKLPGGVMRLARWSLVLTPMADDAWKVAADGFPMLDIVAEDGSGGFSLTVNGFRFDGVFEPRLFAFLNSTANAQSVDFKIRAPDRATGRSTDVAVHQGAIATETKAVDVGGGAATIAIEQKIEGGHETVRATPKPNAGGPAVPPVEIVYDFGPSSSEGSLEGLRALALRDLWLFLVARADQADLEPAEFQSELKAKVLTALPIWDKLTATLGLRDLTMETTGIKVALKNLSETVAMSGLTARGSLEFGVKVGDLSVNSALLPAWAEPLTPTAFDFDVKVSAAGLDQIVRLAIDDFDIRSKPPLPPASGEKIKALLISGEPKLTISPGHLTTGSLDLSFEGELALTPPKPTGRFKVMADGLDKIIAIVGKAAESDARLQKALLGATFLKGLAVAGPDGKLLWDIELGADGAVSVNGMPMPKAE